MDPRKKSERAHLTVKELLYTCQALLSVDAQSRLDTVYWVIGDCKDDGWNIVVMEE